VNRLKTWVLIAAMGGLFVLIGGAIFHSVGGLIVGLAIGIAFNFAMYWYSAKISIATTHSKPVTEQEYPQLYTIVRELTQANGMPMPQIYVSDMAQPNAFATGRDPHHAVVAVTKGLLQLVDEREVRGVLAHELSHVANHDILIGSIAAGIAMSITFIARFAMFFGRGDSRSNPLGPVGLLLAWILAPIAAAMIQMAVSRSREYQADDSGAHLSHDPLALAGALQKLEAAGRRIPPPASVQPSEAHMFIVNPYAGFRGGGMVSMFSTHPPTGDRIARLQHIAQELGQTGQ
jgi:heat shock protein HtpX